VSGAERSFTPDEHHVIEAGRVFPVWGNIWRMLVETGFAPHFEFYRNSNRHYGVFAGCGTSMPFNAGTGADPSGGGC